MLEYAQPLFAFAKKKIASYLAMTKKEIALCLEMTKKKRLLRSSQ